MAFMANESPSDKTKVPFLKPNTTNKTSIPVTEKKVICMNLTEKQVNQIASFINNFNRRNMPICSCDIQRVLELNEDEFPTRFKGSK